MWPPPPVLFLKTERDAGNGHAPFMVPETLCLPLGKKGLSSVVTKAQARVMTIPPPLLRMTISTLSAKAKKPAMTLQLSLSLEQDRRYGPGHTHLLGEAILDLPS